MIDKDFNTFALLRKLSLGYKELEKITDKWGYIRQAYNEIMPFIMAKAKLDIKDGIDPYFFDWTKIHSPIEEVAWQSIRSLGAIALYPQFPLFNFFIDFANPYLRIGLEMDGKDYHDVEKDKLRDQKLADFGWKIYHIKGSECFTRYKQLDDIYLQEDSYTNQAEIELRNWFLNTCEGVVYALREIYFKSREERNLKFYNLALQTLDNHRIAKFDIPNIE